MLLRCALLCQLTGQVKYEAACLMVLLLFDEAAVGVPDRSSGIPFSLPKSLLRRYVIQTVCCFTHFLGKIRNLKQTTKATATRTRQNKGFNGQINSYARVWNNQNLPNLRTETTKANYLSFHLKLNATRKLYAEFEVWCSKRQWTHPAMREIQAKNIHCFV